MAAEPVASKRRSKQSATRKTTVDAVERVAFSEARFLSDTSDDNKQSGIPKSVFFVTLAQSSVSVDVSLGVRRGDPVILQNTGE
jgi:hypothetical protein